MNPIRIPARRRRHRFGALDNLTPRGCALVVLAWLFAIAVTIAALELLDACTIPCPGRASCITWPPFDPKCALDPDCHPFRDAGP